jgi:signal transduction histidine kinase
MCVGSPSAATFSSSRSPPDSEFETDRRLLQDVSYDLRSPLARLAFATEVVRTSSDLERGAACDLVQGQILALTAIVSS